MEGKTFRRCSEGAEMRHGRRQSDRIKSKLSSSSSVLSLTKYVHPPTSIMVLSAIRALKRDKGSSYQAIIKFISNTYDINLDKQKPYLKKYLKSAVASGHLRQLSGKGACGSFKLAVKANRDDSLITPLNQKVKNSESLIKSLNQKVKNRDESLTPLNQKAKNGESLISSLNQKVKSRDESLIIPLNQKAKNSDESLISSLNQKVKNSDESLTTPLNQKAKNRESLKTSLNQKVKNSDEFLTTPLNQKAKNSESLIIPLNQKANTRSLSDESSSPLHSSGDEWSYNVNKIQKRNSNFYSPVKTTKIKKTISKKLRASIATSQPIRSKRSTFSSLPLSADSPNDNVQPSTSSESVSKSSYKTRHSSKTSLTDSAVSCNSEQSSNFSVKNPQATQRSKRK